MKILVSNPSLQYTRNTVKALLAGGHEIYFATAYWFHPNRWFEKIVAVFFPALFKSLQSKSDSVIPTEKIITKFSALFLPFLNRLLKRSVEYSSYTEDRFHDKWVANWVVKNKPDLIIGYEKSCFTSFIAAKKYGAFTCLDLSQVHPYFIRNLRQQHPFFRSITGSESFFNTISQHKLNEYQLADKIFCLSHFAKNTLTQYGVDSHKIFVNSLGFNPQIFYPNATKIINTAEPLRLIYAGIITKRKGIHILLESLQFFSANCIHLTLIGPAGDASDLLAAYNGAVPIQYIPACSQIELANHFRAAHVFVFPSFLDSWAAVVAEAMAAGLPIITSSATGASAMVNNDCGFVIEPGNATELKNAIQFFIDHKSEIHSMGNHAAQQIAPYTWQHYYQQLNNLITQ